MPIERMLCSDAGMKLMNLDARIMLAAVDRMVAKGIEAVPIHDSIVVAERHEGEAREALNFGWQNTLGQGPILEPVLESKSADCTGITRSKTPQGGGGGGGACPAPHSSSPSRPVVDGWWSAVIIEARFDVAEWVAA
jgi:hypothetical protein